ncbi:hypothetical protein PsYK624_082190 [Phanerochaete sordida]|uniref:Uncharacterized protein n=1 Tax=Phanerochaete sordida TaxID=48140 RepID=A0A9P3LE18_9APHY|nr:hypothetical protein PsYK624_082190 [Phanerochaete sordida]
MNWFTKKEASRKYIDLIRDASSKWANWDPPKTIRAGDIGFVNRDSGEFERLGNIYRSQDMAQLGCDAELFELVQSHPATVTPADEVYTIKSYNATQVGMNAGANALAPSVGKVGFSTAINFDRHRGAFLVMHNPNMTVVPDELYRNETFAEKLFGKDKQLRIVTEVFTCDGYVLYLSNKKAESVEITLDIGTSSTAAASVDADLGATWNTKGGSGNFRKGYKKGAFTPLYHLKGLLPPRKRRRGDGGEGDDGDSLDDVEVPWNTLDSDGEQDSDEEEGGEDDDEEDPEDEDN